MNARHRTILLIAWIGFAVFDAASVPADRPLHQRIDQAIADAHLGSMATQADDDEFLRRVHLDLLGRIPTVDELESFVADEEPAKRAATINRLLDSNEFDDHFVDVLDIMLMERRGGTRITQTEWSKFLKHAVSQRWSFDKIVREVIAADATGPQRGAAKFLIQREVEPNALTRDIGRIFLGRDLQCAQCHDHPNITDYEQSEYYGIFSFVNRSYLFEDPADNKKSYVGEKAIGDAEFKSVFEPDAKDTPAPPALLGGLTLDMETPTTADNAYVVSPSKQTAGVPKFSRRRQLGRLITHPANEHFAKNVVNRLWAQMMGRGLVHPVDFHHSENPPTHPALLQILADEFVASGFDYRELLKQIALSESYQRSIDFPAEQRATIAEIDARSQQLQQALVQIPSDQPQSKFEQQLVDRRAALAAADAAIAGLIKQITDTKAKKTATKTAIDKLKKQLTSSQSQQTALNTAVAAAKKVSELTPDDKALSSSVADYQNRAATANTAVASAKAELEKQTKEFAALSKQANEQNLQLAKLQDQRRGLADMVAEARGALGVFLQEQRQREAKRAELNRQLASLKLHQETLNKQDLVHSLAQRKEQLAKAGEPLKQQRQQLLTAITPLDTEIAAQQAQFAAVQQRLTAKNARLDQKQRTLDALDLAVSKAESVAGELDDEQIQSAAEILAEKRQALEAQLTEEQRQLQQQQATVASSKSKLDQLTADKAVLTKQQTILQSKFDAHESNLAETNEQWKLANAEYEQAHAQLRQSWERRYAVRSLVPLTPEQLAGATITALRLRPRFEREAAAEWEKKNKDKKPEEIDESAKQKQIATLVDNRVSAVVKVFVSLFAPPGGSPQDVYSATADQALFMANDGRIHSWLALSPGTLLHDLQSITDDAELAQQLYLAIHSRRATDDEKQRVSQYLASRPEQRNQAIRELAWGLLSSLEFRFNR